MKKAFIYITLVTLFASCGSKQQYIVTSVKGERIQVVTNQAPDPQIVAFVGNYKLQLDKEMNQVIGQSAQYMPYERPESLLTNLTSDIMQQLDTNETGGKIDLALMNVHGHRAPMPKGDITVGDIYEIYSFDNTLAVLEIKGKDLIDVFKSYAEIGGAGISATVKLIIKDGQLIDAKINGQAIDPNNIYRLVTLDYLADGNDGMNALKNAVSDKRLGITLRDYMLDYVKKQTAEGKEISSILDGRITIQK